MKRVVIGVLVLVAVLVAVDFGAAAATEYQVSQTAREELDLVSDPNVRITGFPFLTQAVAGEYDSIEVVATGVPVGQLRDVGVEATLRTVEAPLSQLFSDSTESIQVERVVGRVRVRDSDLGRLIGVPDLRIAQPSDEQTEEAIGTSEDTSTRTVARLTGSTELVGERSDVTIIAILELVDGQMQVTPTDLYLGAGTDEDARVPKAIRAPLLAAFSSRIDPGTLPFAVDPTAVEVEAGSLVIEGATRNVLITGTAETTQ